MGMQPRTKTDCDREIARLERIIAGDKSTLELRKAAHKADPSPGMRASLPLSPLQSSIKLNQGKINELKALRRSLPTQQQFEKEHPEVIEHEAEMRNFKLLAIFYIAGLFISIFPGILIVALLGLVISDISLKTAWIITIVTAILGYIIFGLRRSGFHPKRYIIFSFVIVLLIFALEIFLPGNFISRTIDMMSTF